MNSDFGFHGRNVCMKRHLISKVYIFFLLFYESYTLINLNVPRILIMGPPGSGKGTQSLLIKNTLGCIHSSVGEMLRNEIHLSTEFGIKIKEYMDEGNLVPDDILSHLVCSRLNQSDCLTFGWILDGFPRTQQQANVLEANGLNPDIVIVLDVPDSVLLQRILGRRMDPTTGIIYHLTYDPPPEHIKSRLIQRHDDTIAIGKKRIQNYLSHVQFITSFYASKVELFDGTLSPVALSQTILQRLANKHGLKKRFKL